MKEFRWQVRVYYEDTDAGGVVYHSHYLNFYERARTEMLRTLGINQDALLKQNIGFVVKHMIVDYIAAVRLDTLLTISTKIISVKKASVTFEQTIVDSENKAINRATVLVACIDMLTMKPTALPKEIVMEFTQ